MTKNESIVHSLIEDLAAGKLVESSQFELTEDQKDVKIPAYLIYLAGLLVSATSVSTPQTSSLSARDNEQFESFQKIFAEYNGGSMPIFRLSPRLCTTDDQLGAIQSDLGRKRKELERKAREATEDLLLSMESRDNDNNNNHNKNATSHVNSTKAKKKRKKKAANKLRSKEMKPQLGNQQGPTSDAEAQHEKRTPQDSASHVTSSSTLEQVISQIQSETTTSIEQDDTEASAWIPVSKNKNMADNDRSTQREPSTKIGSSVPPSSEKEIEGKPESSVESGPGLDVQFDGGERNGELSKKEMEQLKDPTVSVDTISTTEAYKEEQRKAENNSLETPQTSAQPASNQELEERIRQLEDSLQAKDQELQQEKQLHAKILSQKQQQFDDQVQALQLRLYISQTRLKTFEDALEQHVQAVASNVATSIECDDDNGSSGRTILHQYTSPKRQMWVSQNSQAKDEKAPSPLISRLLRSQKKLENDSEATSD